MERLFDPDPLSRLIEECALILGVQGAEIQARMKQNKVESGEKEQLKL